MYNREQSKGGKIVRQDTEMKIDDEVMGISRAAQAVGPRGLAPPWDSGQVIPQRGSHGQYTDVLSH